MPGGSGNFITTKPSSLGPNSSPFSLNIFKIGLSWGGVTSLAVVYPDLVRPNKDFEGRLVRLNIGLEATNDLINDLEIAISKIN